MEERTEKLERLIPKLKANKKILPLMVECMEWELRALKAEKQIKNHSDLSNVSNRRGLLIAYCTHILDECTDEDKITIDAFLESSSN